ncbi:hypothetical protein [Methanofollis fontis]|uniref:Uncharacterized protein n=1 Tax=Methanofollis fontis TaxID=2052832 RepID=A0A483CUW4_9EURY|nr:hypothetical protein [Methanofollis fontis]TAJ45247.1 hypothetical protein CUJ86_00390 [Methanofollis fontis]
MGACKEGFYNSVERDLKKAYRADEGWILEQQPSLDGAEPDYVLVRRLPGKKECILVNVRIAAEISDAEIDLMNSWANALSSKKMAVKKALLVVPQDVVAPADLKGVELFYLRSYAVKASEVIWTRSSLRAEDGKPILA